MARRLHSDLLLLLTGVVVAAMVAAAVAVGVATRQSNAERLTRVLHAQVVAADALSAARDASVTGPAATNPNPDTALGALGIVRRETAPAGERPGLPLLQRAEARLIARLPGRELRLMSGEPPMLWLRAQAPQSGWIGIAVLSEPRPFRRGVLLSLFAIGVLVLIASALFARSLTRPLRSLAEAAQRIVSGEPPPAAPRFASREIHDLRAALAEAAAQTQAAARDRELMLAGISHDLRTPLARLRYALALGEGAADADARAGMERDIDELDAIVGQFIDAIRDGRDEPAQTIDLVALLGEIVADEARRGVQWRTTSPQVAMLRARPMALRRALCNLFDNAARHGAAPFEAVLEAESDGWCLRLRDQGPGVSEAVRTGLGRPFHRGDQARSTAGTGLGLYGALRVARMHRGDLRLTNPPEGGAVVELRLRDSLD